MAKKEVIPIIRKRIPGERVFLPEKLITIGDLANRLLEHDERIRILEAEVRRLKETKK